MNEPRELIGKTIAGTEPLEYGGFRLHFSDGTSADFEPQGYEADGIGIRLDSYTGRMRRGCIAAGEREQRRVEDLAREIRRRDERELIARKRAELSPADFEQWRRERDPLYIFKQVWRDEIQGALNDEALLLNRQFYGGG
jgi:hypothetical protein